MVLAIIGAGAAGLAAAIAASEYKNVEVKLLERQARVGRKLQATGNGRCNLSNIHAAEKGYHGTEEGFWSDAIQKFPPLKTLEWFHAMGLFTVTEESGKVYPYSDQANSVVDILRFALNKQNIQLFPDYEVYKLSRTDTGFEILSRKDSITADRVIIACGGIAGTKLGGSMSGYKLLRSMGHSCTRLRPALVQIKSTWPGISALKGVRANCCAEIYHNEKFIKKSQGEIQFTEFGLSGPVIFELSRDVCSDSGVWECRLDFLPHVSQENLMKELQKRRQSMLTTEDLLTGIVHNRLGRVLTQCADIRGRIPVSELSDLQIDQVCRNLKEFSVGLKEPLGMDAAQVTAGGIDTREFDSKTMESKLVPGLYACGEVLDVDGDCGGYNLQWAWSSGRLAGMTAGKEKP